MHHNRPDSRGLVGGERMTPENEALLDAHVPGWQDMTDLESSARSGDRPTSSMRHSFSLSAVAISIRRRTRSTRRNTSRFTTSIRSSTSTRIVRMPAS